MDRYRLVFPPVAGYLVNYFLIMKPMCALLPEEFHGAAIVGQLIAYIGYDLIHYYLHHATPTNAYFKDLKKYHMLHHYKNGEQGFGVSSKLWDYVFGTTIKY